MADYYATPDGDGDGSSESPFSVADFIALPPEAGDTLWLNDGTYDAAGDMLVADGAADGESGNEITVQAVNDGLVVFDGGGGRCPIQLRHVAYWTISGVNAHDSYGTVVMVENCSHVSVKRVVAWNARANLNYHVFAASGSPYTLLEDCAGFGYGRKIFSFNYGANYCTGRRCWGRWEGCTYAGPKSVYNPNYNCYRNRLENSIGTWTAELLDGVANERNGIFVSGGYHHELGYTDHDAYVELLGCIAYTTRVLATGERFEAGFKAIDVNQYAHEHCSSYIPQDDIYPFALYRNRYGTSAGLSVHHCGGIGGRESTITSHWDQESMLSTQTLRPVTVPYGGEGATIQKRYVDGVLTDEDLWPWPMDQRIYDALVLAGYEPFTLTSVIAALGGAAPGMTGRPIVIPATWGTWDWTDLMAILAPPFDWELVPIWSRSVRGIASAEARIDGPAMIGPRIGGIPQALAGIDAEAIST